MHSSRMRTARSLTVSHGICRGTHVPCHTQPHHACPLPHMPPATHAPYHACPPSHAWPPAMHAPCHAHPPCHACPLPCMPPCHTCPLKCMPPATHAPPPKSEYSLHLCAVSSASVLCFQYDICVLLFAVFIPKKILEIYIPPGVQLVTNITTRWCNWFPIVKQWDCSSTN